MAIKKASISAGLHALLPRLCRFRTNLSNNYANWAN